MDNNSSINKLLDFLGDAVLIVNETSKIVFSNNACCTLLGYSKNELLDMQLSELINPSSINTHDENVARFIEHQSAPKVMSERNLITCYKKNGQPVKLRISISCLEYQGKPCAIAIIHDFTSIQASISELENKLNREPLTGLLNQRYLDLIKHDYPKLFKGQSLGIAFLDLDRFKPVNDQYGHDVGDILLKKIAQRLTRLFPSDDYVFRIGGDEFLVIFKLSTVDNQHAELEHAAKRIHHDLTQPIYIASLAIHISVGVSVGIAYYPFEDEHLPTLISKADEAMYYAKKHQLDFTLAQDLKILKTLK
ncbi:sensor domain-containing diguanylate cyclase [Photobacterium leiognathi]|uniref:sensor domain-containing diguanylate cyclase n=1 Tax=Photobacterium leiognathi TaxID=553611 RepID=UPI00298132D6|nr:sensor domain-containing diguanylate cyclase [Photobacterium leiognathi]